ncbi:hypothetical protein SAMN05444672_1749 [Bacillus sp. OK838]|nr:hypothetical protein SAMN05444672_1749 [Bacillus sp. OK838]
MNESAIEWIKEYFTNKENISDIVMVIITIVITYFFGIIPKIFKWLGKLFGILGKWLTNVKNRLLEIPKDWVYKRTIKKIERGEIPVTDEFLWGKSPEKNPELRKIYQMMDDGVIESPALYKLQKSLKDNSILENLKKNVVNVPQPIKPIKLPPFKK